MMSEVFKGSKDYVASEDLMRAVNIAMVLQKPLLIKGVKISSVILNIIMAVTLKHLRM